MPIYTMDMTIHATAQIVADTPEEAREIAKFNLANYHVELKTQYLGNSVRIVAPDDLAEDDIEAPFVSLAPYMTIGELDDDAMPVEMDT